MQYGDPRGLGVTGAKQARFLKSIFMRFSYLLALNYGTLTEGEDGLQVSQQNIL